MFEPRPKLEPHRCKTALYHRRCRLAVVATAAGVTVRHIVYVIAGQRPGSQRVYQALRDALGPHGWAYATGATNVLRDDGGDHAAR